MQNINTISYLARAISLRLVSCALIYTYVAEVYSRAWYSISSYKELPSLMPIIANGHMLYVGNRR